VRTQPERLENLRPDLPPALSRIIHKMLAKDPAERYQSPRELLLELRALKIEGMDLEWPAELDELSSVEHAALGTASWAATQRLQAVMASQARRKERRWIYYTVAAVLAAFALGGGLQLLARGPFLLETSSVAHAKVMDQGSPEAQYLYAVIENTIPAYLSVIEYYGDSKYYVRRARQGLATVYLEQGNIDKVALEKAMELFQESADLSPKTEPGDIAFGLGGEAIVLYFRHEPRESLKKLSELYTHLRDKCNAEQRQAFYTSLIGRKVQRVADYDKQAIDKKDLEQFSEVLESLSTGEAASGQTETADAKK